jgi:hypothetical protein
VPKENYVNSLEHALIELEYAAADYVFRPGHKTQQKSPRGPTSKQVIAYYEAARRALEIAIDCSRSAQESERMARAA